MDTIKIRITPKWRKTKEDIWAERFDALPESKVVRFYSERWFSLAIAAAIVFMAMLSSVAYFYKTDINAPFGEHATASLPDGSKAELNAGSSISYKPFWWKISREVEMKGEIYFEVAKGRKFVVHTSNGTVSVLGTSFNVFSREDKFNVICLTGKVKVSTTAQTQVLEPDMQTKLQGGQLHTTKIDNPSHKIEWRQGRFYFQDTPLLEVIEEIERQYNIKVSTSENIDYFYTGNFPKDKDPEEILRIIEKPYGIKLTIESIE